MRRMGFWMISMILICIIPCFAGEELPVLDEELPPEIGELKDPGPLVFPNQLEPAAMLVSDILGCPLCDEDPHRAMIAAFLNDSWNNSYNLTA